MNTWHDFPGPNAGYVLDLYDRYRQNPESGDAATRAYFAWWTPPVEAAAPAALEYAIEKIVGAVNLAQAIRGSGHLAARLDPLGSQPRGDPMLLPATHGVTEQDLRGGTFTITNGGVFGSLLSAPILNPPQVGILGLHKIEERPIALNGQVVIRPMMYVALSYDHRVVDGREAVQFLVRVKELIEDPEALLLEG
jgi:hypothetical protein